MLCKTLVFTTISTLFLLMTDIHTTHAASLESVKKIRDKAPHEAFTDLIRYNGTWFCAFREGLVHAAGNIPEHLFPEKVMPHGSIRIISSKQGEKWRSRALISSEDMDLRGPHLSITDDDKLMLVCNGTRLKYYRTGSKDLLLRDRTLRWFSSDGKKWQGPRIIGELGLRLWEITWHRGKAYTVGYGIVRDEMAEKLQWPADKMFSRLYQSENGRNFETHVDVLRDVGKNTEASLVFTPEDKAVCLHRRSPTAEIGVAEPPYKEWTFQEITSIDNVGGPELVRLPDGRIIGGGRIYDEGSKRTGVFEVKPQEGDVELLLSLPSGGDNSYPGMVWHNDVLWISYYSGHEGQQTKYFWADTAIYLAKVKFEIDQENE